MSGGVVNAALYQRLVAAAANEWPLMKKVRRTLAQLAGRPSAARGAVDRPLLGKDEIAAIMRQAQHAYRQAASGRDVRQRHAGDLRSVFFGSGLDYEEARPYQRGDDVRAMDWRITARTGRPHVKTYREERQPLVHIVVDRHAGMRFGTRRQLKVSQAARAAALFAFGAALSHAGIGGTLWQPDTLTLRGRNGFDGALDLVAAANAPCPPLEAAARGGEGGFAFLLRRLEALLPRGSRVVLISDFTALEQADLPLLSSLASQHEVLAVQIYDAAETALPDVGLARFWDVAAGRTRWVDTGKRAVRDGYAENAEARRQTQAQWLRRAGVSLLRCATDGDPVALLMEAAVHG